MSEIDPRLSEAVEHVQRAALELIAAARNALDVAEDLARNSAPLQALVEGVLATLAPTEFGASGADAAPEPGAARVQRIRVD